MTFVDFMIVGAAKCGTTTIAEILTHHPEVSFCKIKEPHFFSKTPAWQENLESYRALYDFDQGCIRGEASTTYTCYPEFNKNIPDEIYEFNPNLKIIYLMRDPIPRIRSQYAHNLLRGYAAATADIEILSNPSYINRTRYYTQINPYIEKFGRRRILLLTLESFVADKIAVMRQIADFLGISNDKFQDIEIVKNKSVGEVKIDHRFENFMNSNPGLHTLRRYIPKSLKSKLTPLFSKQISAVPEISNELERIIVNLLSLEISAIEQVMQREIVEWSFPKTLAITNNL